MVNNIVISMIIFVIVIYIILESTVYIYYMITPLQ